MKSKMLKYKIRIICAAGIITLLIIFMIVALVLAMPTTASETIGREPVDGAGRIENEPQNASNELVEDIKEEKTDDAIIENVDITEPIQDDEEETDETTVAVPEVESGLGEVSTEVYVEPVIEDPVETVYDTPFDENLQSYTVEVCNEYGVDPALVFAVIEKESTFNINAVGDYGRSLGLMQIQPRWNQDRMAKLNCWDLMDPYQNIRVGVDLIAELFTEGYSVEGVLMAYNGGRSYADYRIANGIVTDYVNIVLEFRGKYA